MTFIYIAQKTPDFRQVAKPRYRVYNEIEAREL